MDYRKHFIEIYKISHRNLQFGGWESCMGSKTRYYRAYGELFFHDLAPSKDRIYSK